MALVAVKRMAVAVRAKYLRMKAPEFLIDDAAKDATRSP
jgi:DNA-directed RNA polymerase subunit K/omega